jgi:hypothetical protein
MEKALVKKKFKHKKRTEIVDNENVKIFPLYQKFNFIANTLTQKPPNPPIGNCRILVRKKTS